MNATTPSKSSGSWWCSAVGAAGGGTTAAGDSGCGVGACAAASRVSDGTVPAASGEPGPEGTGGEPGAALGDLGGVTNSLVGGSPLGVTAADAVVLSEASLAGDWCCAVGTAGLPALPMASPPAPPAAQNQESAERDDAIGCR